ncbi:MAG TPA: DUF885 domain-containing protein [Rhizomicrobium sp.]|jgi:uncharacterized protein (DUF885 family)
MQTRTGIDRRTVFALAGGGFVVLAMPAAAQGSEDARLYQFFEDVFQRDLSRSPMRQSRLGIHTNQDKWDDISEAHEIENAALKRSDLERLHTFAFAKLSAQSQLSYRMFEYLTNDALALFAVRQDDYLISQMGGMHTRVPVILLNSHPIATGADADAYIARLAGVKPLMDVLITRLTAQEAAGVYLPKFCYPLVIEPTQNVITGAPFDASGKDSPLLADFRAKVTGAKFSDADRDALLARANTALLDGVGPGYRTLIAHLEAAQGPATDIAGVWRLPNGDTYYRAMLKHYTTLPVTAKELHQMGLDEVARIQGEMRGIMQQLGFTGTLPQFFDHVRNDPNSYYPDNDAGRAQFVADAKALLAGVLAREDDFLGVKPKADVVVRPVEAWRAKSAAKAFYQSPPEDGSQPGIFYINLYDMKAAPKYELAVELYHEAVPGHHIETELGQEIPGLPRFRKFASIAAYSEGWALYAEGLAKELGLYHDAYQEFGRLSLAMMRAARLVVDTGIHSMKWTRDEAIAYFDANMPATHFDNAREIDRYIVLPGQANAYEVGKNEILKLRAQAQAALGDRFVLKDFHDAVVDNGPLPLPILAENVSAWIAKEKART